MKEILILSTASGLAFVLFLVTLILGLIYKNKLYKLTSLFLFLAFIGLTSWAAFKLISKSYKKVTETFRPRTGEEIYEALFYKRQTDCIKILNYQDQIIPKIDYAIWLHFKTCPGELKRILNLHDFNSEIVSTKTWKKEGRSSNQNWFTPETLGDSIMVSIYEKDKYGNSQYIYSSLDSTEAFVKDILD